MGNTGLRVICPNPWTVRVESLKSVLDNWSAINMLLNNSLEKKLDPAKRDRINGVQSQTHCFNYYFGVYVLQLLLRHSDNLSKALQNSERSACEGQTLAAISVKTLEKTRNDDSFDSILDLIKGNAELMVLQWPTIPRKCENSAKYLGEQETPRHNDITEEKLMYGRVYFNAVDNIIVRIKEQFDQSCTGFKACQSFEKLLTDTTHDRKYQGSLSDVLDIHCTKNKVFY